MRLHHEADVPAPVDRVWERLLDVRVVAAAFPGAHADPGPDPRAFTGRITVRLGLLRLTYAGHGRYETVDAERRRVTVVAQGDQGRGPGRATMRVEAALTPSGTGTHVVLDTDLALDGATLPLAGPLGQRVAAPLVRTFLDRLGA